MKNHTKQDIFIFTMAITYPGRQTFKWLLKDWERHRVYNFPSYNENVTNQLIIMGAIRGKDGNSCTWEEFIFYISLLSLTGDRMSEWFKITGEVQYAIVILWLMFIFYFTTKTYYKATWTIITIIQQYTITLKEYSELLSCNSIQCNLWNFRSYDW